MNDTVTLDISTYNSLKADSVRANMIVDHLFRTAKLTLTRTGEYSMEWDSNKLCEILELAYPKRYANKLAEFEGRDKE